MRSRTFVIVVLLFVLALPVFADSAVAAPGAVATSGAAVPAVAGHDPLDFLGMDMKAVSDSLGVPQDMFSFRGSDDSRDSVVFYYPDHVYLFWYKDRVWQVRYDKRYTDPVRGFTLGMTMAQAQAAATQTLVPNGDSLYFDINERAWPVRVRLLFTGDILTDVYVYRSDF